MTKAEQAWHDAAHELGVPAAAAIAGAQDLARRYTEPHRHYHLTEHVDAVVSHCFELAVGFTEKTCGC